MLPGGAAAGFASSAAHCASKRSSSWELLGAGAVSWLPSGGHMLLLLLPGIPLCWSSRAALCDGRPLTADRAGNPTVLGWCCPRVPTLGPAPAEPTALPAAVQKTLATICEGVMPTTGTTPALGYVMLLASPGMYVCMGANAGCSGGPENMPTGAGVASNAMGKGCMELGSEPGGLGSEGGIMAAPDMMGADMVGMDMEGRDMGGPVTAGPGMRGMDDTDMGGRDAGVGGATTKGLGRETVGVA